MKPCPFCKSKDLKVEQFVAGWSFFNYVRYSVYCNKCNAIGPQSDSVEETTSQKVKDKLKREAVKLWDKR